MCQEAAKARLLQIRLLLGVVTITRILKYEPRDFVVSGHCLDVLSAFIYVPFALFPISMKIPLQHEIIKPQQQKYKRLKRNLL